MNFIMKKSEKMNPDSVKSLKEFRQKQIETNKKLHIIFLIMIGIVNICFLYFIITYKKKISEINLKSNKTLSNISKDTNYLSNQENLISHKLVNIFSISNDLIGNYHFSFLIESSEEVQMIKNFIKEYIRIDKQSLFFAYQGKSDTDDIDTILDILYYYPNMLMIIGTKDENRFGYYFGNPLIPDKSGIFESYNNTCFIFSFQTKEKYKCLNNGKMLEMNKNNLFNIGNGDIIINYNFLSKGGVINYPFKSFDIPDHENNVFTKENGEFEIRDIEIFVF